MVINLQFPNSQFETLILFLSFKFPIHSMAPKGEKKPTEKKPAEEKKSTVAEKAPAEKKPKARMKFRKESGSAAELIIIGYRNVCIKK